MNTWQLCPKCNGQGQPIGTGHCDLCNGTKVISTLTGKPPLLVINNHSVKQTINVDKPLQSANELGKILKGLNPNQSEEKKL